MVRRVESEDLEPPSVEEQEPQGAAPEEEESAPQALPPEEVALRAAIRGLEDADAEGRLELEPEQSSDALDGATANEQAASLDELDELDEGGSGGSGVEAPETEGGDTLAGASGEVGAEIGAAEPGAADEMASEGAVDEAPPPDATEEGAAAVIDDAADTGTPVPGGDVASAEVALSTPSPIDGDGEVDVIAQTTISAPVSEPELTPQARPSEDATPRASLIAAAPVAARPARHALDSGGDHKQETRLSGPSPTEASRPASTAHARGHVARAYAVQGTTLQSSLAQVARAAQAVGTTKRI